LICKSSSKASNQSQHIETTDLYPDSADDLEIDCCFFDFHEIKASPRNTQNPVTDLLVSEQATQSSSQNAFNQKSEEDMEKNSLTKGTFYVSQHPMSSF
jgi:hypothetical protein